MGEQEADSKRTRERKFWSTAKIDSMIEAETQRQKANDSYKSDSDIIRTLLEREINEKENDFRRDSGREITVRYPGKCVNGENCVRPSRSFKAGERIIALGNSRYMCIDCHSELGEGGDKQLHKRALELRRFERLIKEARREADLALLENELDALPKTWLQVLAIIKENERVKEEFLTKYIEIPEASRDQVMKFLENQARQYLKVGRTIKDTQEILLPRIIRKKNQKRIEQTQAITKEDPEDDDGKQAS